MKTRTMQIAVLAGIVLAVSLLASPYVFAATTTSTTTNSTSSGSDTNVRPCPPGFATDRGAGSATGGLPGQFYFRNEANLTVGQTITITNAQGRYQVIGTPSENGTASGTLTFSVTGKLDQGYILAISGGSFTLNGATYTIASGTAQTGRSADVISGQGTTTPTGEFLLRAFANGSFGGTTGQVLLDLQAGSTEYAIALSGTVSS